MLVSNLHFVAAGINDRAVSACHKIRVPLSYVGEVWHVAQVGRKILHEMARWKEGEGGGRREGRRKEEKEGGGGGANGRDMERESQGLK